MNRFFFINVAVISCLTAIASQAQELKPYKTGDKITSEAIVLGTRGREVFNEAISMVESQVASNEESYTFKSSLGSITYARKTHQVLEIENERGKRPTPESQRLAWMPLSRDFTKPYQVTQDFQATQNCGGGIGKATYEGLGKPGKFKVKVSGVDIEVDIVEVTLEGKWQVGPCGSGRQVVRIVYSPQLDQVLENDFRNFLPNGFLNSGRISKTLSIN